MNKINFQNLPSTATPVNATNLNQVQTNVENEFDKYYKVALGTAIPANTDLNTLTTPGIYYSGDATNSATLSNTPTTTAGFRMIVEQVNNPSRIRQTIIINDNRVVTYLRNYDASNTWGDWFRCLYEGQQMYFDDTNTDTFNVRIYHKNSANIKCALIFTRFYAGVVSIGNNTQIWLNPLGTLYNITCTATILNHADTYVDVKLKFSEVQYGGINVIRPFVR